LRKKKRDHLKQRYTPGSGREKGVGSRKKGNRTSRATPPEHGEVDYV